MLHPRLHILHRYTVLFLACSGAVATAITNTAVQPLEVVKTRMQATGKSMSGAAGMILRQSGPTGLMLGGVPTFAGNFVYG